MRAANLILIATLILLMTGAVSPAEEDTNGAAERNYGLGWIEEDVAYINLLQFMLVDDTPDIVQEIVSGLEMGSGRETVEIEELAEVLPNWATGPILLIGPGGRIVVEPSGAFVERDDYHWVTHVGIVIELQEPSEILPDDEEEDTDDSIEYPGWVVAVGPWSLDEGSDVSSAGDSILEERFIRHEIVEERLEEYTERFLEEYGGERDNIESWWVAEAGNFEGSGMHDDEGGSGFAVFYCLSTRMEFAGVVEIMDIHGDVRVEARPWEGIGEFHGWYFEPIGATDVDGDGWDELIVRIKAWELDTWELWDSTPSGTEVMVSLIR